MPPKILLYGFIISITILLTAPAAYAQCGFAAEQLAYEHVKTAKAETDTSLARLWEANKLPYPVKGIFIRVFKREKVLELWAKNKNSRFVLVKSYAVCRNSGVPGPKRKEGDLQVPEGFYNIAIFNPLSDYYLSLGINYPNASDKLLSDQQHPGSDIMIHGDCVTVGCVPITDDCIKEVYWAAVQARCAGQDEIPVHIFPAKLTNENMALLEKENSAGQQLISFWKNLKEGYDLFEKNSKIPRVKVDNKGKYIIKAGK